MRLVPPPAHADPLVDCLIEALRYYRGAGHRSLIVAYVQAARRGVGEAVDAEAIVEAFERGIGKGPDDPRPFRLPFGAGSHRWALKEALDRP